MGKYHVAYNCIFSEVVEADSPMEAADIVEHDCPFDVDGAAFVVDQDTGEEWDI